MMRAIEVKFVVLSLVVASLLTSAHPGRSNLHRVSEETTVAQSSYTNGIKRIGDAIRKPYANDPKDIHTRSKNQRSLKMMNIIPKEKEELQNYVPSVSIPLTRMRERKSWVTGTPNFQAKKIYSGSRHRGQVKEAKFSYPRWSVETTPPNPFTVLARDTESVQLQRLARFRHTTHTEKSTPSSQATKSVQHTDSRTDASESTSPIKESSGVVKGHGLERNAGEFTVAVASQKPDDVPLYITDETEQQGGPVFFWSWEAAVIISLPIVCVASLLLLGFLTRARIGVRVYRFLKWKTTFDLQVSRRIGLNLEEPHVFRTAEAVTDQGEAKNGSCVGVDLKYYLSSKRYVSYFDADGSLDSFDSQYGSEAIGNDSTRSCGSSMILGRTGSVASRANHRGSAQSQSSLLRLWGGRKFSTESRASMDSQFSLQHRRSEDSQRSFMMLWYAAGRKGSADSQFSNDAHSLSSRRDSSGSQQRQMAKRHGSLDSTYGSLGSREGPDGVGESGGRTKRRDSPMFLETTLHEAALQAAGRIKSSDLGEEMRYSRTLSLIYEEDKDEHHP